MKILGHVVSSMYVWTIVLLSILAAVSSYALGTFPSALLVATLSAGVFEILIHSFYQKRKFAIPFSGIITGMIIGAVAPINAPLVLVILASAIAILSKFFIKFKSTNIFNPASFGLIVALAAFGLGDEWWVVGNYNVYGMVLSLTPVLVILAYEARRLPTGLSFMAANISLTALLGGITSITASSVVSLLFGVNYLFAFVMLIEPKTSPHNKWAQVTYGASIAVAYVAFAFMHVPYALLVVLLAGNVTFLLYRMNGKR